MAGRAAGADDSQYSALSPFGIDDKKNHICSGNANERQSLWMSFIGEIDPMGIEEAFHSLDERNAVFPGITGRLIAIPLEFPNPNCAHVALPDA
jgi:hypothetical protein